MYLLKKAITSSGSPPFCDPTVVIHPSFPRDNYYYSEFWDNYILLPFILVLLLGMYP